MAEGLDFRAVEGFLLRLPAQVKEDVEGLRIENEELGITNDELRIEKEREEERRRQNELMDLAGLAYEEEFEI